MTEPADNLRVVVVGGRDPDAVGRFVANVPKRSQLAIVLVGCELDAAVLRSTTQLPVTAVDSRARLAPDHVFVIPDRRHAAIDAGEVVLEPRHGEASGYDGGQIDATMRAAADAIGRSAVGVVLYGKGTEGALGIKRIKEAGGLTIAQRPDDGDLAEMAKHAIATGLIDLVLPIEDIPTQVLALLPGIDALDELDRRRGDHDAVRDILTLVRLRTDHDFTAYKRATLLRRIARRTQVCGCDTIVAYHTYLREHPHELANLLRDFLISVTSFFRDPKSYDALAREALPRMFANRSADDTVRVWVAGCATGEEAYSIAILMLEHARTLPSPPHVQVFATDIDENALAEARLGWYPETIAVDVSADRLERYFTRENGRYRVSKEVRELVLFSPHNLLRDPPFSRLDLVTCRNLLIYLDRSAQDHVLTMFHFGLRTDGMMFLGSSESVESTRLFTVVDPKHRLFARRAAPTSISDALSASTNIHRSGRTAQAVSTSDRSSVGELHHRLVEQYAPPSVLVDANLEIVHLSEHAGRFLQLGGGEPTRELMKLVLPSLQLDLRGAIYRARQAGIDRRVVRFEQDGRARVIEIRVRHVESAELGTGTLLVFFDELAPGDDCAAHVMEPTAAIEPVVREIEEELQRTRDRLRSTIEQYETSLEELKASNEELQAINEELRSTTEELETNKEELQSVNEELMTLNRELAMKIEEVSTANSDLQNLMTSTQIGVVFLDRELCIKRFTPRVQDLFNLIASDLGRPLAHLTHKLEGADLSAVAQTVLDSLRSVERELHTRDGRRYLVRWLPYRSLDDRIDGVVLTFVDVTDLRDAIDARRRSEAALHLAEERLRAALRVAPIAILSFDAGMRALWAYANGRELADPETYAPLFAPGEANRLVEIARQVVEQDVGQRAELELELDGRTRTYDFRIEPTADGASAVGFDITPSKLAEVSLLEADRRKDEFLATLSNELRSPIAPLKVAVDVARLVDDDPAKRAQSLSIMERQIAMLSELVDELVDLSLVTHGKVELACAPVDLTRAVASAVEASARLFAANGLDVRMHHPGQPVLVDGDQRRLVQVVANLLSNAAHHTPPGGHVDVDVAIDRDRRRVSVRVTDDGAGIAPEQLSHMFDIFVQSRDARGRSQGGLGIGLSVVRRLVELHGGEVDAFSDGVGTGSTFIVHLPIRKE